MTEFKKYKTTEECENVALDLFSKAVKGGKWMIGVWRIDDKYGLVFNRVTCNFPRESFIPSMDHLKETILEELSQEFSIQPLPLAPHLLVEDENGEERRIEPTRTLHEETPRKTLPANVQTDKFPGSLPKKEEHNEENN